MKTGGFRLVGYECMKKEAGNRPFVAGILHSREIVHHSDVDELLGISNHTEDRLQVWSPALGAQ